jgi:hypothetical protein
MESVGDLLQISPFTCLEKRSLFLETKAQAHMSGNRMSEWLREGIRFLDLHSRSSLLTPRRTGGSGIVVSLTTLPSRIGKIFPAVNSLLDQTSPPEMIFISVPSFSIREQREYTVPAGLLNHPAVSILSSGRDWGPATKLMPAVRMFESSPETLILAVDDDNVYPRTFLETFNRFAMKLPDAALSLRGWPIPPSRRWKDSREFKGTQITTHMETDVITGCGGILVRPRFFDTDFFNYDQAPHEAFFVDDLWVSGHLARRGIPRYVIPFCGSHVYLPSLATLSGPALDRDENRSGRNNDTMIAYFGRYWAGR